MGSIPTASATMNICVFGDSITWGGYDPKNGGWVTSLRNYLESNYDDITTYNLGICGEDSSGLRTRFVVESRPRNPDLIIIAIGANDVKHQPDTSVSFDKFQDNIEELISQATKITKKIIILGITPVDETLTTPRNKPPYNFRENKDIYACNKILKELAITNKLAFVPIPAEFTSSDLADGLHPNTGGHTKIFETVKPIISSLI